MLFLKNIAGGQRWDLCCALWRQATPPQAAAESGQTSVGHEGVQASGTEPAAGCGAYLCWTVELSPLIGLALLDLCKSRSWRPLTDQPLTKAGIVWIYLWMSNTLIKLNFKLYTLRLIIIMNNNNNYVLIVLHASVDFLNAYYLLLFIFVTDTWHISQLLLAGK